MNGVMNGVMEDVKLSMCADFNNFVRSLRGHNRHFITDCSTLDKIHELVQDFRRYDLVEEQKRFFRARFCNLDDCEGMGLQTRGVRYGILNGNPSPSTEENPSDRLFAGFEADKCGAPPAHLCSENRASGKGIKRLYVAESARTAIVEMKPSLGNVVSVAEMQVYESPFLVLNLTKSLGDEENDYLCELINKQFSLACSGDSESYSFTQWFADLAEHYGHKLGRGPDTVIGRGIKYSSAMHKYGENLVIFGKHKDNRSNHPLGFREYDSEEFFGIKAIRSEIYYIRDVKFDLAQVKVERGDVFELEEH
ncbi:MAG: RES family NAD+ phosphorylase [Chitinispirillia bacterium]|nr:RES family NAD+ phosphorylase [Chitinispirillia bacterium]MCL2269475.1 RES family NAD+ phosphorylase [Chitinispirillia bacterium]